jgi:hypothetical protein
MFQSQSSPKFGIIQESALAESDAESAKVMSQPYSLSIGSTVEAPAFKGQ